MYGVMRYAFSWRAFRNGSSLSHQMISWRKPMLPSSKVESVCGNEPPQRGGLDSVFKEFP